MSKSYDFSGWATKNDLLCSDGRVIRTNAFEGNDGTEVPLVWNHKHDGPKNIIGHALLENRAEGVYAYCSFNNTENAGIAKELVHNGDIKALSIYANQLKQKGADVIHGVIREVSLVLAGANPGACIENVLEHADGTGESAVIYADIPLELIHSDEATDDVVIEEVEENEEGEEMAHSQETPEEVFETLTDKQKYAVSIMLGQALEDGRAEGMAHSGCKSDTEKKKELEHAKEGEEADKTAPEAKKDAEKKDDETVEDVFNTLSEKQKTAVYAIVGQAIADAKKEMENKKSEGGKEDMKHNVFEADENVVVGNELSHAAITEIFKDAKAYGSLKESVLAHSQEYGIENIDTLFPDAKTLNNLPEYIKREDAWVSNVLGTTHHTPFARIKSIFADITADEARAKGYIKGNLKKEEVFTLLKRQTLPTTIYKKQKLDRDDILDITSIDIVAWLKQEMRMMINEELARAILVGDQRSTSDNDKIPETNIRPVWKDADLYTVKHEVKVAANATDDDKAKAFIRACVKARKNYKGSGSPVLYTTEDMLTDMILLEDTQGRKLYSTEVELAAALRVSKIVTVPVMEGLTRTDEAGLVRTLGGIIVNLVDYNIGTDNGGQISMFDDFDIDYNQQKYLMETRCSGALVKPFSAIAMEFTNGTTAASQNA